MKAENIKIEYHYIDSSEHHFDTVDKQEETNISAFKAQNISKENQSKEQKYKFPSDKFKYLHHNFV